MKKTPPFFLLILGASGNLAAHKLYPALYELAEASVFPEYFQIVGYGRDVWSQEEFHAHIANSIQASGKIVQEHVFQKLISHVTYIQGNHIEVPTLEKIFTEKNALFGKQNIQSLVYFALPPNALLSSVHALRACKEMNLHYIFEKPFGENSIQAEQLFKEVKKDIPEEALFLLDHYLGKHEVQSLIELKENNPLFQKLLAPDDIENIQISALEEEGIGLRGEYFDPTGTYKDMLQSHLIELLAILVMETSHNSSTSDFRKRKLKMLKSFTPPHDCSQIVFGQYESYLQEKFVPQNSNQNTFVALPLFSKNKKWEHVHFFLRTGKMLEKKATYIAITYKRKNKNQLPTQLILEIYPMHQIRFLFSTGNKGQSTASLPLPCYLPHCLNDYASLLKDALQGDQKYFLTPEDVIASWKLFESTVCLIHQQTKTRIYKDHSQGPSAQHTLLEKFGTSWYSLPS